MDWYLLVWKRFAEFHGRSRRKEYWMFALFSCLICFLLYIPGLVLLRSGTGLIFFALYFIYALAALIPSLACSVRRLHDTGRSAWWLLICLVPLFGSVTFLVFMVLDSHPETNLYGPNPKLAEQFALIG